MDRGRGAVKRGEEPQDLCDEYAAVSIVLGKKKEIPADYLRGYLSREDR